nr:TonB C-terminal domain-containing protein [Desulfobacula sp.]
MKNRMRAICLKFWGASEKRSQSRESQGWGMAGTVKEGGGVPDGTGKGGSTPLQLYLMEVGSRIQQNWAFNESLARMDRNLEVRILIKILKSGEIRDIIFETRSGNSYLDESAKKAIMKINPLKPLPAGMYSYDMGLIFTPQGVK